MTYQQFLDRHAAQSYAYTEDPSCRSRPMFKPRRAMIYLKCDMEHITYCNSCVNLRSFCRCTQAAHSRLRPLLELRKV